MASNRPGGLSASIRNAADNLRHSLPHHQPFRRVAMMAAVQRFNQDPLGWLRKFSSSATVAGRTAIARLLSTLPDAIAGSMRGTAPLPVAPPGYWCQAVEVRQIRLKLAVNWNRSTIFVPN